MVDIVQREFVYLWYYFDIQSRQIFRYWVLGMVLGAVALTARMISCFLCGITAGLLVRFFFKGKAFFCFDGFSEKKSRDTDPNLFMRFLKNLGRNIKATGVYFLIGILLSAVFQRYVPRKP